MSFSFRIGFFTILLLLGAVITISYLFDRERAMALESSERAELRRHAERAADDLLESVVQLRQDTRFLASTPPLQSIRAALRERPWESLQAGAFAAQYRDLAQIFLAFAHLTPSYFQIRLIGIDDNGRELVRVERSGDRLLVVGPEQLQEKGAHDYVRDNLDLMERQIRLSRIDLNRERGSIRLPETPTLRAVTPVTDADGSVFALLVVNVDMRNIYRNMEQYDPETGRMYLIDDRGYFLMHPDPAKSMTFERISDYRLADEFPQYADAINAVDSVQGLHFDSGSEENPGFAFATRRILGDEGDGLRDVILVRVEPALNTLQQIDSVRNKSNIEAGLLLLLATLVTVFLTHRLTRSLRSIVQTSQALASGNYDIDVPETSDRDLNSLNDAFRNMLEGIRSKEQKLVDMNQSLEQQVIERTRELEESQASLSQERQLLQAILDNVGDGVVAVDGTGAFLLWNQRAVDIIGKGPTPRVPEDWSAHYGLYRSELDPLPRQDLPLHRAIKGETVRNQAILIRNHSHPEGRWVSVTARPLGSPGESIQGAVAVLVDIQELRRLDALRVAQDHELRRIGHLALIAQIVDTATHTLSQPLAAIGNYSGAALQMQTNHTLDNEQLQRILNHINRLAERGGKGLQTLRTLTQRDGQPHTLLDINNTIHTALGLLYDRLDRENIELELQLGENLPLIDGQAVELQKALVHLLLNAIESLAKSTIEHRRIHLTSSRCDSRLRIEIGDNGPGIPQELEATIFEPWFTTKANAMGLGLAVARSIAENHNGDITLEQSGDGMKRFVIDLPILTEEEPRG